LRIGEVGTPPPIRMKKKSKERERDEKHPRFPLTPPLPQQNLIAAVFLVPNRKERELLSTQGEQGTTTTREYPHSVKSGSERLIGT